MGGELPKIPSNLTTFHVGFSSTIICLGSRLKKYSSLNLKADEVQGIMHQWAALDFSLGHYCPLTSSKEGDKHSSWIPFLYELIQTLKLRADEFVNC